LQEVKDIKGTGAGGNATSGSAADDDKGVPLIQDQVEEREEGSPFFDLVVMFMFLAYMCLMVLVNSGAQFLLPILLQEKSFGIYDPSLDEEANGAKVSFVVGMATIPLGLFQVIVAVLLFVPVTQRFGEVPVIGVMGAIATCVFPIYGLYADCIWKVVCLNAVFGMCFGFLAPALGPVSARYGSSMYPKQMAIVQGIPLVGAQLSNSFAQMVMAAVVGDDDTDPHLLKAYCFVGVFAALFTMIFAAAASLSAKRVQECLDRDGPTGRDDGFLVYSATLKRSPLSVGFDIAPLPLASSSDFIHPMRRAISVGYASEHPVQRRSQSTPARNILQTSMQEVGEGS